ncbi:phosphatase PAP2 family protein [Clostridiaceae bacterium HSG29]|nr:phosphatase PAP2 family protein [Clostridiaceae bacterium HSG29]
MCPVNLFELRILYFIQENLRNGLFDYFFVFLSKLGNVGIIWILISLYFIIKKENRTLGIMMIFALIGSYLVSNLMLKNYFARPRPYVNRSIELLISKNNEYSFPSGHTSSSFAVAMMIYYFKKDIGKWAFILASLIAFSRLYLFMHYPTDVIGGIAIGILIADLIYYIYEKIRAKKTT